MAAADCYDKALSLLARRAHFRRQLERKLQARRYDSEEIGETLDRLTRMGYLDDGRVAREFVDARLRRGPIGRRRMRLELEKRDASGAAVDEALAEAYSDRSDLEAAREAASRWRRRRRGDANSLARHLSRLGFTTSSVLEVTSEFRALREDPEES